MIKILTGVIWMQINMLMAGCWDQNNPLIQLLQKRTNGFLEDTIKETCGQSG